MVPLLEASLPSLSLSLRELSVRGNQITWAGGLLSVLAKMERLRTFHADGNPFSDVGKCCLTHFRLYVLYYLRLLKVLTPGGDVSSEERCLAVAGDHGVRVMMRDWTNDAPCDCYALAST